MDNKELLTPKMSGWLPWISAIALFMQILDGTILNTALPTIAKEMHKSPLEMQSIIIAYVLTLALLIPLSGWLSDRFGTKNIFIIAISVFTLGSLACGLSSTLEGLIISRIVQGVGGAIMVPVARLAMIYAYPKSQLLKAINFMTIPALIAPILGPVLGGWLVETVTWQWIFYMNIPIGILGIVLAWKKIPNYKRKNGKFDSLGLVLFGIGLVMISLSLDFVGGDFIRTETVIFLFIGGSILLVLYIFHSKRILMPLIDLKVLRIRTLKIGLIGNLVTRLGIGGIPLMLPLMLQVGLGKSPFVSGGMLVFSALATLTAKSWIVPLIKYMGYRKLLISNTFLLGVSISSFALFSKEMSLAWLIPILLIYGSFNSVQLTAMNSLSLADLTSEDASGGNTMLSVMQQLSLSFGISISSGILRGFNTSGIFTDISSSFKATFIMLGVITMISAVTFKYLRNSDGAEMAGNKTD